MKFLLAGRNSRGELVGTRAKIARHVLLHNEESSVAKVLRVDAIEPLWDDGEYVLHRAVPEGGQPPLLVTSPALAQSRPATLRRLEHAYALRDQLDPAWSARPVSLTQHQGRPLLLLEDPGGEPLARLLGRPMERTPLLRIAIGRRLGSPGLVRFFLRYDDSPITTSD